MNFNDVFFYVNLDSFIPELVCLSVDIICFGMFYRLYRKKLRTVKAIQAAPECEIDKKLVHKIQKGVIPYAVVRGVVKRTYDAIPSHQVAGLYGVIQQSTIVEHRVQWNPISRWWSDSRYEIQNFVNVVPFHLSNSAIWNKARVHVAEPLASGQLKLTTVYDKFTPKSDTLGGYLIGWVRGERSKGFQVTEKLLTEGTVITGVGALVLENNEIKLCPPPDNLEYFLSPLTKERLVTKLEKDVHFYKVFTVSFGILGAYIMFLIARSWYQERQRKIQVEVNREKKQEFLKQRRRLARDSGVADSNATPVCVVCLNNPVEVMVMECGHVCLCTDCAEQVASCPICRTSIAQTVAAFFP